MVQFTKFPIPNNNKCLFRVICLPGFCLILYYTAVSFLSHLSLKNISLFEWNSTTDYTLCPVIPPNLEGRLKIRTNITLSEAENDLKGLVLPGGSHWPSQCQSRWKVAVIVPFRDREYQFGPFLFHMHRILQKQQLYYTIYVIQQSGWRPFNRAKLLNVGYRESEKDNTYDCFAFHDIDLLPEDDRHLYHCSQMPRHLNVAPSNNKYRPLGDGIRNVYFGGACLMTKAHMELTNGWSNKYCGWGAEDDDMRFRLSLKGLRIWSYPKDIARYFALKHDPPQYVNKNRYKELQRNLRNFEYEGLNSLQYDLIRKELNPLYTSILVNIDDS